MIDQKPGLTEDQLSRFKQEGFLKLPQLVDPDQVHKLYERIQELERGERDHRIWREVEPELVGSGDDGPPRKFQPVAVYDAVFQDYLKSDPVRNTLASVLGPDFLVYADIVFAKPARVGSRQNYHQDRVVGYRIDDQAGMVGLWLALDPADEENGCLQFLPGSHPSSSCRARASPVEFDFYMQDRAKLG